MDTRYRLFQNSDLSQIQHLMKELGYSLEKDQLKQNIDEVKKRDGQIIIAEENTQVVGSICIMISARLAEGVYAEIVSLIVDSKHRKNGIGKRLVKKAEEWATRQSSKVRIRTNKKRDNAHSFYESLGYEYIKTQKLYRKLIF